MMATENIGLDFLKLIIISPSHFRMTRHLDMIEQNFCERVPIYNINKPWCLPSSQEENSCCLWLLGKIERKILERLSTHRPWFHQLTLGISSSISEGKRCLLMWHYKNVLTIQGLTKLARQGLMSTHGEEATRRVLYGILHQQQKGQIRQCPRWKWAADRVSAMRIQYQYRMRPITTTWQRVQYDDFWRWTLPMKCSSL